MGLETPVSSRGDGNIVATIVARKFFIFSKNPQSPREGTETDLYHDLVQQLHVEHQLETLIHLERVRKHYTLSRDDGCKFVRNPSHLGRGRKRSKNFCICQCHIVRTPGHLARGRKQILVVLCFNRNIVRNPSLLERGRKRFT